MSFVKMLREKWGNDEMAFYFTQIAPYMYDDPNAREAAFLMWSQAQTLNRIRHSGMAVTHDIGEEVCIHPAKKKEVGDRLAFLALSKKYNQRFFDADPPIADKFEFTDGKAIVTFRVSNFGVGPIKKDLEGFVAKELAKTLKGNVEASFSKKVAGGFTIGPKDGGYFISFTDETFNALISEYLRPATKKLLFG